MARNFNFLLFVIMALVNMDVMALSFPLPESNSIKAKMPMHLVFPRPDDETPSYARHRWAHPDFRYEIPIGVQGGAWPFKYEIITGPVGATIGESYGDDNYGVVSWTPSTSSGSESFTVRITDQELNTVDSTWNVTLDASQFVFIQDGYSGVQVGTIDQPLEDWSDWFKNDNDDSSYSDLIVVFRGGNYTVKGDPSYRNGDVGLQNKTSMLIGYPDETPVLDFSTAIIRNEYDAKDGFYSGLRFENSRQTTNNSQFFNLKGFTDRTVFWNNYFYNHDSGQVGDDNTSGIYMGNISADKYNILIKGNTFDEFNNNSTNGSYVDFYRMTYLLVEENIAKNSNNPYGFWMKATTAFVTVRANEVWDNINAGSIVLGMATISGADAPHDHEVCWNLIKVSSNISVRSFLAGMNDSDIFNTWIYRNTIIGGFPTVRNVGVENYKVDANVVVTDRWDRWDTGIMDAVIPNLTGDESDVIVDSMGALIGSSRSTYLGIRGHEIVDNYITTPKEVIAIGVE